MEYNKKEYIASLKSQYGEFDENFFVKENDNSEIDTVVIVGKNVTSIDNICKCTWERVIKPNGAIVMTAREPFTSVLVLSRTGFYKHKWVWNKVQSGSFQNAKYMPLQIEEDILVFSKGKVNYYPIMRKGRMRKKGGDKNNDKEQYPGLKGNHSNINDEYHPVNILEYPNCSNKQQNIHPTQKPVDLFRYLIKTYSNEGETVFDGYSGSGTTAVACMKEKRVFVGSELDKTFFDLSTKRLVEISSQPELF